MQKNRETPRDYYADEAVWNSVRACADVDLQRWFTGAYAVPVRDDDRVEGEDASED